MGARVSASWRCEDPFERRAGVLLVVGTAPCVHDDIAAALALRSGADKLLINEAAGVIEVAQHVLAGHCYHADYYMRFRARAFPSAPPVLVHASYRNGREMPKAVTHRWRGVATGGTSAWKAVRIGKALGYDEIILCGCPMEATGYAPETAKSGVPHDCMRFGKPDNIRKFDNYRNTFKVRATEEGERVFSMSGWSRQILGVPA